MKRGIIPVYYLADSKAKVINEEGHYLFLCNGGNFKGILEVLLWMIPNLGRFPRRTCAAIVAQASYTLVPRVNSGS
jgi:hypothetical protein